MGNRLPACRPVAHALLTMRSNITPLAHRLPCQHLAVEAMHVTIETKVVNPPIGNSHTHLFVQGVELAVSSEEEPLVMLCQHCDAIHLGGG